MNSLTIVRGTMMVATVAWAVGEALMKRSRLSDRRARAIWTIGIALALIHVALSFHFVYGWNHEAAVAATARQTADRIGWSWRGGIYVNFLFRALWLLDVAWWWIRPESHISRSTRYERTRLAVFVFMFFNGAVVFASGIGRVVGICSMMVVLLASVTRNPRA